MTQNSVLVKTETFGYFNLSEGSGENMLDSDYDNGYVDYIYFTEYDTFKDLEECNSRDGGMILLKHYYQDMFNSPDDVVKYVIDTGFMPDVDYEIIRED